VINVAEQVGTQRETREAPKVRRTDDMGQFVAKVLGSTEDVWTKVFKQSGRQYRPPTLVLYDGQVRSGCGIAQAAMGPFYCPNDEKLYIDLAFFRELQNRFRAPGDFAQAYVIAHEVGHHVQKLTGGFDQMESSRGRSPTRRRCDSSCRPIATRASGGTTPGTMNQLDAGDTQEALQCRGRDRRRSRYRNRCRAALRRRRGPTARRHSG
jgi:predicted metalloprotease